MDRGLNRQALEGFHLLRQSVHDRRQRAKGQRSCALRVNNAVNFHHRIIIKPVNRAVVAGVDDHLFAKIVVDGVNQLHRHFGVVRPAAEAQLFGLFIQLGPGIDIKQLLFHLHHLFRAGAFGFRRLNLFRQHRRRQPEIAMIGTGDCLQGPQKLRRPRQRLNIVHRERLTVAQHVDDLTGHLFPPLHHLVYPDHMVQPGEAQPDLLFFCVQHSGNHVLHIDGHVAQADDFRAAVAAHRLRHDPCRIGKIKDKGVRRQRFHLAGNL